MYSIKLLFFFFFFIKDYCHYHYIPISKKEENGGNSGGISSVSSVFIPYLKGWFFETNRQRRPLLYFRTKHRFRGKENSFLPPRHWESSRIEEMRSDWNALKKENRYILRPLSAEIKRQSKVCGDKLLRIAVAIIFFGREGKKILG